MFLSGNKECNLILGQMFKNFTFPFSWTLFKFFTNPEFWKKSWHVAFLSKDRYCFYFFTTIFPIFSLFLWLVTLKGSVISYLVPLLLRLPLAAPRWVSLHAFYLPPAPHPQASLPSVNVIWPSLEKKETSNSWLLLVNTDIHVQCNGIFSYMCFLHCTQPSQTSLPSIHVIWPSLEEKLRKV